MRHKSNLFKVLLVCLCLLFSLAACTKKETQTEADPARGTYNIYYKNSAGTELKTCIYQTDTKSGQTKKLAKELLGQLMTQKVDDPSIVPALKSEIGVRNISCSEDQVISINFEQSYGELPRSEEILARAAIVLTLTQIKDVEIVQILVEGEYLVDNDVIVGSCFTKSEFLTGISDRTSTTSKETLHLYFINEEGNALVTEEQSFIVDKNYSMEKLIMQGLVGGPVSKSLKPVLPADTKILGVQVKNGVCYVNLDETFLQESMNADARLTIYAIVNSLCESSDTKLVQLMVNGNSDLKYQGVVPLSAPIAADYDVMYEDEPEPHTSEEADE